jgi:hypothetical protein
MLIDQHLDDFFDPEGFPSARATTSSGSFGDGWRLPQNGFDH